MTVGKSGLMWKLDRVTGKFLDVKETVFQNVWAAIDMKTGRTTYRDDILEKKPGQAVASCPSPSGGHNWQATSYDPVQRSAPAPAQPELRDVRRRSAVVLRDAGNRRQPGTPVGLRNQHHATGLEFSTAQPVPDGVISTAGGVGFVGDFDRVFRAFEVKTGKTLVGNAAADDGAGTPTFSVGGEQFVAVPTGYNGGSPRGEADDDVARRDPAADDRAWCLRVRAAKADSRVTKMRTKQTKDSTKIRSVSDGSAWGWGPMRIKKSLTLLMAVLSVRAADGGREVPGLFCRRCRSTMRRSPIMTGKGTASATLDGDTLSISDPSRACPVQRRKRILSMSKGPGIPGSPLVDLTLAGDVAGKVTGQIKLDPSQLVALRGRRLTSK